MVRFRQQQEGGDANPLVARMGALTIIAELPAAILVADRDGEVVHRNKAAERVLHALATTYGDAAVRAIHTAVKDVIRTERSFPCSRNIPVTAGQQRAEVRIQVAKLPDGYLVHWSETVGERDHVRLLAQTADDLTSASRSFDAANTQINANTADVSERAGAVAAGAEQLSASIRDISASAASAATNTATASQAAAAATARITSLADSSTQIGTVSKLIDSIAATRPTCWRSTPPSRRPAPARRARGSRSPVRSRTWPGVPARRPDRSPRWSRPSSPTARTWPRPSRRSSP